MFQKSIVLLVAVIVIAATGVRADQGREIIFSIDKLDGYITASSTSAPVLELYDGIRIRYTVAQSLSGYLWSADYPLLTFDISSVDLGKAKSVRLRLKQNGDSAETALVVKIWAIDNYQAIAEAANVSDLTYQVVPGIYRFYKGNQYWVSDNLLESLKQANKSYVSCVVEIAGRYEIPSVSISFLDSQKENGDGRPALEIIY